MTRSFAARLALALALASAILTLGAGCTSASPEGDGEGDVVVSETEGALTLSTRLLYAEGALTDTDRIYQLTHQVIGSRARGAEVMVSFNLLPNIAPLARELSESPSPPGWRQLPVFVSWETVNPQLETAANVAIDDTLHFNVITCGLNYRPHPQVIVKADYAHLVNGAGTIDRTYEIGLGFVF